MDKEAQEKIAERLACHADCEWQYMTEEKRNSFREIALDVLQYLNTLGYRKLPKDKPPLLSDEEIKKVLTGCIGFPLNDDGEIDWYSPKIYQGVITDEDKAIAKAQREICVKHYETHKAKSYQ